MRENDMAEVVDLDAGELVALALHASRLKDRETALGYLEHGIAANAARPVLSRRIGKVIERVRRVHRP